MWSGGMILIHPYSSMSYLCLCFYNWYSCNKTENTKTSRTWKVIEIIDFKFLKKVCDYLKINLKPPWNSHFCFFVYSTCLCHGFREFVDSFDETNGKRSQLLIKTFKSYIVLEINICLEWDVAPVTKLASAGKGLVEMAITFILHDVRGVTWWSLANDWWRMLLRVTWPLLLT